MKVYGLIGKKLDHSFSLNFFNEKFKKEKKSNVVYKNFEIKTIYDFKQIINQSNIYGLNVTIPYKQTIIPYLDIISPEVKKINSVNTIKIKERTQATTGLLMLTSVIYIYLIISFAVFIFFFSFIEYI